MTIKRYPGHAAFSGEPVDADEAFFPALDRLAEYAVSCGVRLHVNSSFRRQGQAVAGAVVPPARASNHHVGHAVDANVEVDGRLITSRVMEPSRLASAPKAACKFVALVRADRTLRWGGDFKQPDPVHFDDGLNVRDPAAWVAKLAALAALERSPQPEPPAAAG